jgi:PTH1 family peptidyl-tRNA hydrolase
MRLIVGLGNPGARYERTRHNIGFMAVDEIVRRHRFPPFRSKFRGEFAEGVIAEQRVYVLKPQTYMNDSGESVGALAHFYKIDPSEIAVIHDEIDLAPGKIKVKRGGGSAGHNGLRSIDAALGPDYWRVRLGVGHPGMKELVQHYLLNQTLTAEDRSCIDPLMAAIAEALPLLIADDVPGFSTKVALILRPPPSKPPRPASDKDET